MPTDGNDPNNPATTPEPLTAESVTAKINETVNAALTGHMTRMKGAMTKEVAQMLESGLTPLAEQLAALAAPKTTEPSTTGDGTGDTEADKKRAIADAKHADELKKMQARLDDADAKTAKAEAIRAEQEERTALSQALTEAGVDGPRMKGAMALLYTEERRLARDDDGTIKYRVNGTYGEEMVSLKDGLKAWLETDEGKAYLPPRGATGSGANPSGQPGGVRTDGKRTKADAERAVMAFLEQARGGGS